MIPYLDIILNFLEIRFRLWIIFFVMIALPCLASADTFHVDAYSGDDANSGASREYALRHIQTAIDLSINGDTVLVWPGVYVEEINFYGKEILVKSAADAAILRPPTPDGTAVEFYSDENEASRLENLVIADSTIGISATGLSCPTIRHVTVVNNLVGISALYGASPHISNSIFWYNQNADLFQATATYSCIQQHLPGEGNLSLYPGFASPSADDYHLKSQFGRYLPDPNGLPGTWVADVSTSYCIDAGDPNEEPEDEPYPNGDRVNMGAYGGTPFASKSPLVSDIPADFNNDLTVDYADFSFLAGDWRRPENYPYDPNTDLSLDGKVDHDDLTLFVEQWLAN